MVLVLISGLGLFFCVSPPCGLRGVCACVHVHQRDIRGIASCLCTVPVAAVFAIAATVRVWVCLNLSVVWDLGVFAFFS